MSIPHQQSAPQEPFARVETELARWSAGVLSLAGPASAPDLRRLEETIGRPLPPDYRRLLLRCDGADLHGERLMTAAEVVDQVRRFPRLLTRSFRDDPDWGGRPPPTHLVPIGSDTDGNLKCLDLATSGPEVVDWHRESGEFTTWHSGVLTWFMTALRTLAIRFDYRGRPRPIRPGEMESTRLREIMAHLTEDPGGSFPRLELAMWLEEQSTPEEALFAFREASAGQPERALTHFHHARWALVTGRGAEARSALRRCVAVPPDPNPRKHGFRGGYLPAAHRLLEASYEAIGQARKADEQRRLAERASKRYGFEWYSDTVEYQNMLRWAQRGGP